MALQLREQGRTYRSIAKEMHCAVPTCPRDGQINVGGEKSENRIVG
jgi:hypothetical protein